MDTIVNLKEQSDALTPLLLFEAQLANGAVERWSTHAVAVEGNDYDARVVRHNFFDVQAASDSGIDAIPRVGLTLGNADSRFSQLETSVGFKGAVLTIRFTLYDPDAGEPASNVAQVFQGVLNPPDEITEDAIRLSAVNRMNMQRVLLPPVRIQRRCPWRFPQTQAERQEAADGGAEGRHSRFYHCGYSAGEAGGVGNLDGAGQPFTDCSFTDADCQARGMFDQDSAGNPTRRFAGLGFVPESVLVRSQGGKRFEQSATAVNEARYNDFVPLLYGTVWTEPPVVFARNDGNLTRLEVLLGLGKMRGPIKVIVNDIEIPEGVNGRDMTASGWWNLFADGGRNGGFNLNFTAPDGSPQGDPYGGLGGLSIVVPNQIHDGRSLPNVKVLTEGLEVERFDTNSGSQGYDFSDNPAWILLDVLRRSGWRSVEIDLGSFAGAAAFCDETIAATDNQGNPVSVKRFRCDLAVRTRRRAADVIRGVRNNARLQLTYSDDGRLAVFVENSLLLQQPQQAASSNAAEMLNGGWPAYVFSDGSDGGLASAILRRADGAPAVRLFSKPIADSPNRFSVEFADSFNAYRQDSLELLDSEDIARTGQEISGRLVVDGLPTFDQAARILKFFLDRSIKGNRFIELETSVKGFGLKVGDIIAVTYLKEGFLSQPFRVQRIESGANYRRVRITGQIHDDAWYNDTNGQLTLVPATRGLPPGTSAAPHTLHGNISDEDGERFSIVEQQSTASDGSILTEIEVGFTPPSAGRSTRAGVPLVDLQPDVETTGGSLTGGQTLYYAVTAVDSDGLESNPSFRVLARIPAGTTTNQVTLTGLSFSTGTASFNVYRGDLPSRLSLIAESLAPATTYADQGPDTDPPALIGAPDPQYDHANFYWRFEGTDEQFADAYSTDSIGSSVLAMTPGQFVGNAVRVIRGKGAGQERTVASNDVTTVWVAPDWEIEPDVSSVFVVADNTWRFGGRAKSSPAVFAIPNLGGRVIEITGRAANAQNVESLEGLALVTRWVIGGGLLGVADRDKPPLPGFALNAFGDGTLDLSGVGFATLENTQSISSGTLTLHYRDETSGPSSLTLLTALDGASTAATLSASGAAQVGDLLQTEKEILLVEEDLGSGSYTVTRGYGGSFAIAHGAGTAVYVLEKRTETVSLPRAIFGTPTAAKWRSSIWLPSVRLAWAEFSVTNSFGESPIASENYSELTDNGLRTLRGGQFSLQVDGVMAIEDDAAAAIRVQEPLAIRDVIAQVKQAPVGADLVIDLRQEAAVLGTMTISDGALASNALAGADLAVLAEGDRLLLDVAAVGTTFPGADLTVTVRV